MENIWSFESKKKSLQFNSPLKDQEHLCGRPVFMPRGLSFKVQMEAVIVLSDDNPNLAKQRYVWKKMGYCRFEVTHSMFLEIPGIKDMVVETIALFNYSRGW